MTDFLRRHRMDLWTPAEHAIFQAVDAVERAGCHLLLTDAVVLLGDAQTAVADFVDGTNSQTVLVRLRELQNAANRLIDYCEAHGWGNMPEPYDSINPLLKLLGRGRTP